MAEKDTNAHLLMKRFGSLESQRSTWESHWQEIGDYVVTRKAENLMAMMKQENG